MNNQKINENIFEIRNYIFQIGTVNCKICNTLYKILPKNNDEIKTMTLEQIKLSFGEYCKICNSWYCEDCMNLNYCNCKL